MRVLSPQQFLAVVCSTLSLSVAQLSQSQTNGLSTWGTTDAPQLSDFLADGANQRRSPWGSAAGNDPPPNTGRVRKYEWTVTRDYKSPDGYNKSLILINGQFPGPLLEANWGDTIEVTVHNRIHTEMIEGLTLHWHGLTQKKTPWYDGVPGVSQCPIAPGSSFTYRFQADRYGTSWYHSHYSAQYSDGLYGPMIIHGPPIPGSSYDIDLGPLMLQDYVHDNYFRVLQEFFTPSPKGPVFFNVDNNLINGKGVYNCSQNANPGQNCVDNPTGYAKFKFTPGKVHRLRLINPSQGSNQKFSIDGHTMTVIANDFVPVKPYKADVITLGVGQRTDILVRATGKPTDIVWMRSTIDFDCLLTTATTTHGLAAIYYPKANQSALPANTSIPEWPSNNCSNDALSQTEPYYSLTPPAKPATSTNIQIVLGFNGSNIMEFTMNGSTFHSDYNDPVLLDAKAGNLDFPSARNVLNFGSNSSVQLILYNTAFTAHPMHLHGHDFWVLAEGNGLWDGNIVRPSNPQRRDTQMMRPGTVDNPSYIVLEWRQDNPGVWPLHCHLSLHVSGGLYMNVLEQPDRIQREMQIPRVMGQTCTDWKAFTSKNTPDQIDSGV